MTHSDHKVTTPKLKAGHKQTDAGSRGWRIPLWVALTVPLVTVTAAGMGAIGGLGWWSSRHSVLALVQTLHQDLAQLLEDELESYLETPAQINLLNADALRLGLLPDPENLTPDELDLWGQYLVQQISRFPEISYLGLIPAAGGIVLAQQNSDGSRWVYRTPDTSPGRVTGIRFTGNLAAVEQLGFYDARQWPWFEAIQSMDPSQFGQQMTTPLFESFFSPGQFIIMTALPLWDQEGQLLGSLEASIAVEQLQNVVNRLDRTHAGFSLIVDEESGLVVGPGSELRVQGSPTINRLRPASQSPDPLVSHVGRFLTEPEGSLSSLTEHQTHRCECNGQTMLININRLSSLDPLGWYWVRAVPEAEILATVNRSARQSALLGSLIALGSVLLTLLLANRVTRPIRRLSRRAYQLSTQIHQPINSEDELLVPFALDPGPITELHTLTQALTDMVRIQQQHLRTFHEQELFYRFILDAQTELICRYTPDTRITFINQSFLKFFGLDREQAIQTHWIEKLSTPDREIALQKFTEMSPEHPINMIEREYPDPSGGSRWLEWVDRGIFDAEGQLVEILSVGREITHQKRMEAELLKAAHQKEQLYQQIQQLNNDLHTEVETRTAELQEALQFEAMLHSIGTHLIASLDEAEILNAVVHQMVTTLGTLSCVIGFFSDDKRYYIPRYEYSPGLSSCLNQLFEGESSSSLSQSQSDFGILWQQYQSGIYAHRCTFEPTDQCWITLLNCPIFDEGELLGLISVDRPADQIFRSIEIQLVQQVANLCGVAIRQSRLYQEAQSQVVELERLNLLKDDFVSTVSHELRSPLSNLRMALGMLSRTVIPEKRQQYLNLAIQECDRQIVLVNDLLDMQRLTSQGYSLAIEPVQLTDVLESLDQAFGPQAQTKQQQWTASWADLPKTLHTDPECLSRILRELAHNAIKYTAPGGEIVITAHPLENGIQFVCANSTEIAASELPKLFNKFYRIPQSDRWKHGGTGLGLALVKDLVAQLQGRITVQSAQGWTHFRVWIPCGEDKEDRA